MSSENVHKVKWYYKALKELSELIEVGNNVAEFFEKIHRIVSGGIEVVGKAVPPVAFIVSAVGHIAVLFQLADKQHQQKDYATIGARFIAGVAIFALAITSLVLVQYTLPLLFAATAIETGLEVFKVVKIRLHIRALQKQLSTLRDSPERSQVEHEIVELQNQLQEHQQKSYEKGLEVSYILVATALVVVGMAIPVTAPFVAAAVAVTGVAYTAYRYRSNIKRFFSRVSSLMNRLRQSLGLASKDQLQMNDTPQETDQEMNQEQDSHLEHETNTVQNIDQDSHQKQDVESQQDTAVQQTAQHFLHDQEHALELAAEMAPHPHSFAEAHADDALPLQDKQQQTTDFLQHEEHTLEKIVVADESFREDYKEVSKEAGEEEGEEEDDDEGGEGEGGGESGGDNGPHPYHSEDDGGEGAPAESEQEVPIPHL